jgi:hypothetical protein
MIDILLWFLLLGIPVLLIPGIFILARILTKKHPRFGKLLSLSWLIGIAGLLPGLLHVVDYQPGGCLDICFETTTEARGWPIDWLGHNGIGVLFIPMSILGDICVVALIAFIILGSVTLLKTTPRAEKTTTLEEKIEDLTH